MPLISPILVTVALLLGAILLRRSRNARQLPPGPSGYYFVGNGHRIPTNARWLYFTSLKKKFGDILFFSTLNKPVVVLNSYEAIQDLLHRRSEIYSDRPRVVMVGEIMERAKALPMHPYNDEWRAMRRLFHNHLTKNAVTMYYDFLLKEAKTFAGRLNENPTQFRQEFRLTATRMILGVTYGIDVQSFDDPLVNRIEQMARVATDGIAHGRFLVDIMPWMQRIPSWLPFTEWKRYGEDMRRLTIDVNALPYNITRKSLANGTAKPSFASHLLQDDLAVDVSDNCKMWLSGSMYSAGSDTTVSTVIKFFLAMVLYPDVQEKGAAEIERVIGKDRLPNIDDKENLPYVDGILKEVFRWQILTPLSLPHRLTEDDEYNGLHLPKGSTVLPNSWAIAHDPEMYPDPMMFNPDRYSPADGKPIPLDPRNIVFGYGRRICPGRNFAEMAVWTTIVTVLATTRILRPLDDNGKEYTPKSGFEGVTFNQPRPFDCRIEARNQQLLDLAREEALASTA